MVDVVEYCYVVECTEWDRDTDGSHESWEDNRICAVFLDHAKAVEFVEADAASSLPECKCRWHGDARYSGHYTDCDLNMSFGIRYDLHRRPLL